ncbi:MFS general substrate transporter [Nadsonia fulvescens var. elongata DSM 6958]|uniref:MFS general substrate transporter n=1 Tax=Nadsonia fulvescens var. elongata DSM 6958 TaxID=857566 RepID=A0A1E3PI99_9ASCO|nr:MFS general substrate transporter [Nadsonia fulvescens var. elongata DSM 6958]
MPFSAKSGVSVSEQEPLLSSSSSLNESDLDASPTNISRHQLIVILSSLFIGIFLSALDGTVVTALLSHIASEFNALAQISWIATGYLVACAAFQPIYGKLSDIFGRRPLLVFCNFVFALGCLICGTSNSVEILILGRVVSGIGAGGLTSIATITMSDIVPLRKRGLFQGIGNVCYGIGASIGGYMGGVLSDSYGWRWAFLVQVPLVMTSALVVIFFLRLPEIPNSLTEASEETLEAAVEAIERDPIKVNSSYKSIYQSDPERTDSLPKPHVIKKNTWARIDFLGCFFLVVTLLELMLAISTGGSIFAWSSLTILTLFSLSAITCAIFVYVELYIAREPVIPVRLLTHRTILNSSLANWLITMSYYSTVYYVPIFFTAILDMSATETGSRLAGTFFGASSGSFAAGYYMKRTGRYYYLGVASSFVFLMGVGVLLTLKQSSSLVVQYLAFILPGTGYSAMITVTLLALIAAVPIEFQAVTTSIQYAFRGIGSSLGVSVSASVFQNTLTRELYRNVPEGENRLHVIKRALESVESVHEFQKNYRIAVEASYQSACGNVFKMAFVLAVFGLIATSLMKEHTLHCTMGRK